MPTILLEQHKEETAADEGRRKTAKWLHTIDKAFVLFPKTEYGKGISSYILCGRSNERHEDKREYEIEILVQIEMSYEKDYNRIDSFAYENATSIAFHRVTSTVNHWRPQELEHPRQFD